MEHLRIENGGRGLSSVEMFANIFLGGAHEFVELGPSHAVAPHQCLPADAVAARLEHGAAEARFLLGCVFTRARHVARSPQRRDLAAAEPRARPLALGQAVVDVLDLPARRYGISWRSPPPSGAYGMESTTSDPRCSL